MDLTRKCFRMFLYQPKRTPVYVSDKRSVLQLQQFESKFIEKTKATFNVKEVIKRLELQKPIPKYAQQDMIDNSQPMSLLAGETAIGDLFQIDLSISEKLFYHYLRQDFRALAIGPDSISIDYPHIEVNWNVNDREFLGTLESKLNPRNNYYFSDFDIVSQGKSYTMKSIIPNDFVARHLYRCAVNLQYKLRQLIPSHVSVDIKDDRLEYLLPPEPILDRKQILSKIFDVTHTEKKYPSGAFPKRIILDEDTWNRRNPWRITKKD